MRVDLNADMGESFGSWVKGNDEALLDIISSANIACGFHAGDPDVMAKTIKLAKQRGVGIGCLLYTSPSPRDQRGSRMPSSA